MNAFLLHKHFDSVVVFGFIFFCCCYFSFVCKTTTAFYLMNRYNELSIIKHAKYLLNSTNKNQNFNCTYKTLKSFISNRPLSLPLFSFFIALHTYFIRTPYRGERAQKISYYQTAGKKQHFCKHLTRSICIENFQWHSTQGLSMGHLKIKIYVNKYNYNFSAGF